MSEIPRKEYKTVICPYCGKERTYEYRDAYTEIDYSHGWPDKQIPAWDNDKGCDCILGSLKASKKKRSGSSPSVPTVRSRKMVAVPVKRRRRA